MEQTLRIRITKKKSFNLFKLDIDTSNNSRYSWVSKYSIKEDILTNKILIEYSTSKNEIEAIKFDKLDIAKVIAYKVEKDNSKCLTEILQEKISQSF